ncbi:hypothetical protein [Rhizobium sp.]|uniref:hypothetical protein n=1 Tax=Rhizobium sp. TaxID=391 RepID=UPI00289CFBA7
MPRKRATYGRKKKSSVGPVIGGILISLASIAILSGIGYFGYIAYTRPEVDEQTMCLKTGPVEIKALLIDTTDPVTTKTLTDARNKFKEEMGALPVGGLVEIYGLTDVKGELIKMFSGCNPGDGKSVDMWTSNPRLQQRRWEDAFAKPLQEVESGLQQGPSGKQSPIMAAIQNIKLTVFDPYKTLDIPKKLIVMSDMIEHTDLYSQYKSGNDFAAYRSSPAYADFRTSLDHIQFKVWYIDRGIEKFMTVAHPNFWAQWVQDNHGVWDKAIMLEGVNPSSTPSGAKS